VEFHGCNPKSFPIILALRLAGSQWQELTRAREIAYRLRLFIVSELGIGTIGGRKAKIGALLEELESIHIRSGWKTGRKDG
jgi:hypothetical protein